LPAEGRADPDRPAVSGQELRRDVDDPDRPQAVRSELLAVAHHDAAAHRPADEKHLLEPEPIDQPPDVLGQERDPRLLDRGRIAEAAQVDGEHPVLSREGVQLVLPGAAVRRPAVDEQDRLPCTLLDDVQPDTVPDLDQAHATAAMLTPRDALSSEMMSPCLVAWRIGGSLSPAEHRG